MKADKFTNALESLGWKENPFTLKINPSLFVGYANQLDKLKRHVNEGQKFALITGSTGSGKTTLMLLTKDIFSKECDIIYLGKPPKIDELVDVFTDKFKPSLWERMRGVNVHIHNLPDYVNRKSKRKLVLMVDEIHESDVDVLEWFRTLNDHIGDMQIVMSGLPKANDFFRKNLETLRNRITTNIELTSLSESETSEFIRRRIESVGGTGIKPFDDDIVRQIYDKTGGFPREILKICNELLEKRVEGEDMDVSKVELAGSVERAVKPEIDEDEPESETLPVIPAKASFDKDFVRDIPSKQRRILKILAKNENMYPSEIAEELGIEKYKSKQHAVRSMNNILQRLQKEGFVQRTARGKGFVYHLEPKVRSVLTEA